MSCRTPEFLKGLAEASRSLGLEEDKGQYCLPERPGSHEEAWTPAQWTWASDLETGGLSPTLRAQSGKDGWSSRARGEVPQVLGPVLGQAHGALMNLQRRRLVPNRKQGYTGSLGTCVPLPQLLMGHDNLGKSLQLIVGLDS